MKVLIACAALCVVAFAAPPPDPYHPDPMAPHHPGDHQHHPHGHEPHPGNVSCQADHHYMKDAPECSCQGNATSLCYYGLCFCSIGSNSYDDTARDVHAAASDTTNYCDTEAECAVTHCSMFPASRHHICFKHHCICNV